MATNKCAILLMPLVMVMAACSSSGGGFNDGGTDAGVKAALGANGGVPQNCQSCVAGSTSNECSNKAKLCTSDENCVALNTCVNNCTDINAGCVNNCGDTASVDVQNEWLAWASCTCATCSAECGQTFCGVVSGLTGTGTSDAGSTKDGGDSGPTCAQDMSQCANDSQCCSGICSTGDGLCGCVPSGYTGCGVDSDCCSASNQCINGACQ